MRIKNIMVFVLVLFVSKESFSYNTLLYNQWTDEPYITFSWIPTGVTCDATYIAGVPIGGVISEPLSSRDTSGTLNESFFRQTFLSAMHDWSQYAPIKFRQLNDSSGNSPGFMEGMSGGGLPIRIGAHNDDSSIAHSHVGGDIHLNRKYDNIVWEHSLKTVATHEVGHSLGLAHSDTSPSVMLADPFQMGSTTITSDDIAGIQSIYETRAKTEIEFGEKINQLDYPYNGLFATNLNIEIGVSCKNLYGLDVGIQDVSGFFTFSPNIDIDITNLTSDELFYYSDGWFVFESFDNLIPDQSGWISLGSFDMSFDWGGENETGELINLFSFEYAQARMLWSGGYSGYSLDPLFVPDMYNLIYDNSYSYATVPEPSTVFLLIFGMALLKNKKVH